MSKYFFTSVLVFVLISCTGGNPEPGSHIDALKSSGPYCQDKREFNIHPVTDPARAAEIRDYFHLDTLFDQGASTWEKTLAIAKFVAANVPHANQTVQPEKRNAIYLWEYTKNTEPAAGEECWYYDYMAKNTYWFSCWETIHFDQEPAAGKDAGRYIHLVPKGFKPFGTGKSDIVTSDAGKFWAYGTCSMHFPILESPEE